MADKEVTIKVSADTAKAKADVEDVKKAVEDVKKVEETPPAAPPSIEPVVKEYELLKQKLQDCIRWTVEYAKGMGDLGERASETAYKVDDLLSAVKATGDAKLQTDVDGLFKGQGEEITQLALRYADLRGEQAQLGEDAKAMARAFKEGSASTEDAGAALEEFRERIRFIKSEVKQISALNKIGEVQLGNAGEIQAVLDALQRFGDVSSQVSLQQGQMQEAALATAKALQAQRDGLDPAAEGYAQLAVQMDNQVAAQNALLGQISGVDEKLGALQDKQAKLAAAYAEGKVSMEEYGDGMFKLSDEADKLLGVLEGLGDKSTRLEDKRAADAERAAQRVEKAREKEAEATAKAAEKQATADAKTAEQMRLMTSSAERLASEIASLTELRRAAAEAGDAETYELATKALNETRAAYREVAQASEEAGAAGVRTYTTLRGAVGNFIKSLFAGKLAVRELGMALKALAYSSVILGAIQLAMDGIMWAWEKLKELIGITGDESEKAGEKMEKAAQRAQRAVEDCTRAIENLKKAQEEASKTKIRDEVAEGYRKEAEAAKEAEQAIKAKHAAEVEARKEEAREISHKLEMEAKELEWQKEMGEISEEKYRQLYDGLRKRQAEAKAKEIEGNAQARQEDAFELEQFALEKKMDAFEKVAQAEAALKMTLNYEQIALLEAESKEAEVRLEAARKKYEDAQLLSESEGRYEKMKEAQLDIDETTAKIAQLQYSLLHAAGMEEYERRKEDLKQAQAAYKKWGDEEKRYSEQFHAAEAALVQAKNNSANELNRTLEKIEADSKLAALKDKKKRQEEAAKREAEYNREIASELSKITEQYKVTGSYKEEDNRSAKQIRDCDRTILEAKERELRDLLARTSDAATREKIQAALDDTEKAQRALADATRKAADQEAKRLKNMAPPEFHSKNKQVDRNLQSLGKSYARYAKAAEKAAEAGDAKAMEKAQKRMQYYAGRMGRASKDQEKADRMYKKDAEALEAVAEEHGKDYQHVKRAGQDKRRQEAAEARRNRRANQEAARQQRTQQQAAQPQQQPQPQVNAQEVAAKSQAAMQELAAQVAALTGACNGVAAAADGAAKAAKNAVKTLNQKLKSLNEEVSAIREEVDA